MTTTTTAFSTTQTYTHPTPGATTYATTVTQSLTSTFYDIILATSTRTIWEKGCSEWACQTGN